MVKNATAPVQGASLIRIITDNKPRELQFFQTVPKSVREHEFDYVDKNDDTNSYFKFKEIWYDASQFMRCPDLEVFKGWDGIHNDTFFSGILIKYKRDEMGDIDPEAVIVGSYYS